MTLLEILDHAGLICPENLQNASVLGVTSISSRVKEGYVFVCIDGIHTNGHSYIAEAIERGAIAVVIGDSRYEGEKTVLSENTRKSLSYMLDAFYGYPSKRMKFVGITGTNGKTSVSIMLKSILESASVPCGLIGTVKYLSRGLDIEKNPSDPSSNMTTPDPEELYPMLSRMAEDGVSFVIMEATSHALALEKLAPIEFEIGVFTNLTQDHLDFHKTMEDYFSAKLKLCEKSKTFLVNCDDDFGKRACEIAGSKARTCSQNGKNSDYFVKDIKNMSASGVEYTLCANGEELLVSCSVPGSFSVMNSLQAAACALEIGVDKDTVHKALSSLSGICGRLERVSSPKNVDFSVFIDYAHTPDAIENLIKSARSFSGNDSRIVILFGCGGDRDKTKRAKMGRIASENADLVIVTSDNCRSEQREAIIGDIVSGISDGKNFLVIPDRKEAIEYAIANARGGDVILLAGKGHETYEICADGRHSFDEREIVRAAYDKYYPEKGED